MSCRTTSAGSAFTSYARLANGGYLSDVATLSTFHYLRSLYQGRAEDARRTYTDEDYRALLERQLQRARTNGNLSDARRASIIARLEQAQADDVPDQATLYALFNLNPTVRDRGRDLNSFAIRIADELADPEMNREAVLAEFHALENSIDRARGAGNPDTYTEENIAAAREAGLGTEAGSVHAYVTLTQRGARARADHALTRPQRVVRTVEENPEPHHGVTILEHGYDPRSRRLEVVVRDEATGEPRTYAYRNVPENIYNGNFANNDPHSASTRAFAYTRVIRGNSLYEYSNQIEADLDSVAPRCAVCGQFANSLHSCPAIATPTTMASYNTRSRWSRQRLDITAGETSYSDSIALPAIREMRDTFQAGPIQVNIHEWMVDIDEDGRRRGHNLINGAVTVYRAEDGTIAFNNSALACRCDEYRDNQTCRHVTRVNNLITARLTPAPRVSRPRTPEERAAALAEAQRIAEAAALSDWTRNGIHAAEARSTWRTDSESSYSENFDRFETAFNAATAARDADTTYPVGRSSIPYLTENALDGMATRGSGQAFGMEIEYEFPPAMSREDRINAQQRIGQQLKAAGLSASDRQAGYGASRRNGFQDTHVNENGISNWSWEHDGSVNGGELVSPGMYDEPETWERLAKVTEILRSNGAVSSRRAGAHVHVGTAMYQGDATKYTELARLMTQHEDVITRLASDPTRGTHRNNSYSRPMNDVPADGFAEVSKLRLWQGPRYRYMNFAGVSIAAAGDAEHQGDHPEFRIFDSTLDAGAMQAQIKLAVAITHAAARNAELAPTQRPKEELGSHARRARARGRRRMTSEELAEDTATFRSLLDTLFRRDVDKDQMTHLFALNKWTPARR